MGCEDSEIKAKQAEAEAEKKRLSIPYNILMDIYGERSEDGLRYKKEICQSLGNTPEFDSSSRRAILKEYGMPNSAINNVESNITLLFNSTFSFSGNCEQLLVTAMKGTY